MAHISVVSPVYRAEKIVPHLVERIENSIKKITSDYEIILVEDSGPDNSWEVIEEISKVNPRVVGIKLSRNFGQHYAITAGLDHSKGDWVVVMDCDLQDQPEEIEKLYRKAQEGYPIVLARRHKRKDKLFKRMSSVVFYKTLSYLTGSNFDFTVASFGIYQRKVINSFCLMRENIRVFPILINWLGYETAKVNVDHTHREAGESSYSFKQLFKLGIDIILAFSDKPLRLVTQFGVILSGLTFLYAAIVFVQYLLGYITVSGYASLIILLSFFSGIIITILGIIGLYIGKIFEGVKGRPLYIVEKIMNENTLTDKDIIKKPVPEHVPVEPLKKPIV